MKKRPPTRYAAAFAASVVLLTVAACSDAPTSPVESTEVLLAPKNGGGKPQSGTSVTGVDPAWARQGETRQIRVTGTGFEPGDVAVWERDGVADPLVQAVETDFVSSTELLATVVIDIDADLALFDVAVYSGPKKKGVIIEAFEVTSAIPLPQLAPQPTGSDNSLAWGVGAAGHIVGRSNLHAFVWTEAGGIVDLGDGQAFDVDDVGTVVVGTNSAAGGGGWPMVWRPSGTGWVGHQLSAACVPGTVRGGTVLAVSRDGTRAGGFVRYTSGNSRREIWTGVTWDLASGSCTVLSATRRIMDVTDAGWAVGDDGYVFYVDGTHDTLAPLDGSSTISVRAISEDGRIAVGASGGQVVYWLRGTGGWSGATVLPSGECGKGQGPWASDVSADGTIVVGKGCDGRSLWYLDAGGAFVRAVRLPGFGPTDVPTAEGISGDGLLIAGGTESLGAYWKLW